MSRRRGNRVVAGWVAMMGIAAILLVPLQQSLDRARRPYQETADLLWIPSGKVLRALSLGQNGLLAHIYWTRSVQYYGRRLHEREGKYQLLASLLDITVTLDPYLLVAYKFGAIFLSAPPPYGAGQPEKAVELLRRGIEANPDEWRLWHDLGFVYYWELQDYQAASAAYLEGSKHPRANPWMRVMAAVIAQKGGNRETSQFLWAEIYHSSEDETIRQNALMHLHTLRALDDVEELEGRAAAFRDQTGRWPTSFAEMISQGLLEGVPADPEGYPYQLLPEGRITLHPQSIVKLDYGPSPSSR